MSACYLAKTAFVKGILENISSTFDVGSGTGAGFFALKAFDDNINVELFERDKFMIETF